MTEDEDVLAGIDLQTWRVPPPAAVNRPSLLERALSPKPPKRMRMTWLVAALALVNLALASLVVILFVRPVPARTVTVLPAGGSDAQVRELLARLDQEQHDLEAKLAETKELRAVVTELSDKVRQCEERDRTVQKHVPTPIPPMPVTPLPVTPLPITVDTSCDEVSCVLQNYPSGCCDRFKMAPVSAPPKGAPEVLDRTMISDGISRVKASVTACATTSPAKGIVKVRVRVAGTGRVTNVEVERAPDVVLARCVATAVQRATFERTLNGGSFSYPFVF